MRLCLSILSKSVISSPFLHAVEHLNENLKKILSHNYLKVK